MPAGSAGSVVHGPPGTVDAAVRRAPPASTTAVPPESSTEVDTTRAAVSYGGETVHVPVAPTLVATKSRVVGPRPATTSARSPAGVATSRSTRTGPVVTPGSTGPTGVTSPATPFTPTRKIPARCPDPQVAATRSSPAAVTATALSGPAAQPDPFAAEATEVRRASTDHADRSPVEASTLPPSADTRARRAGPDAASASVTGTRPSGRMPVVQVVPASAVTANGEKVRSRETPKPAVAVPEGSTAMNIPPLDATPGGVARTHFPGAHGTTPGQVGPPGR